MISAAMDGALHRRANTEDIVVAAGCASLIETIDGFFEIEAAWKELEARCKGAILFQTFDWCRNCVEHSLDHNPVEPRIFAIWRGGELSALLPLCLKDNQGLNVLTGLSEPFQQYTEMLIAPGEDAAAIFGEFLGLMRRAGADYLHLGQVREDSALFAAMEGRVPVSGEADAAPYVALSDWPDFDSYYREAVKAKTRKNMRNARNRLERTAPPKHHAARDGELLAHVIDRSFAGREAWLERQGLTSRAFRDSGFGGFVERFKRPDHIGVETIAFSLTHEDKPIADQWGFVYRGRYYAFMAGWDSEYEQVGPGKLHLGSILEECFTQGIETADFMIPAARYKLTWATGAVPVRDHVLALSMRGVIHNRLWLDFGRPVAKKLAYSLPTGLRSKLFRILMPSRD